MNAKQLVGVFSFGIATAANGQSTRPLSKPNIILIIADDHGYYHMSPYGDTGIPTPNLQKLADKGLRFDRAYVN